MLLRRRIETVEFSEEEVGTAFVQANDEQQRYTLIVGSAMHTHKRLPEFSPFGRGGDWSTQPLGEILDQVQDGKEFRMICMKYNCHCEKDHA